MNRRCPKCGRQYDPSDGRWPVTLDDGLTVSGCLMCWEAETGADWWEVVANRYTRARHRRDLALAAAIIILSATLAYFLVRHGL